MACETALPYLDDVERMLRIIVPLVEEHMPKARAHDGGYCHIDEQLVYPLLPRTFVLEHLVDDIVANRETDEKHKAVPAHSKEAKLKQHRVGCPCDKSCHNSEVN